MGQYNPHRKDENEDEIVVALRQTGHSVLFLSSGADILVGRVGVNLMFEIKVPGGSPSRQALTPKEKKFHEEWRGQVAIVTEAQQIIDKFNEIIYVQARLVPVRGAIKT